MTNEQDIKNANGGAEPAILASAFDFTNDVVTEEEKAAREKKPYVPAEPPNVYRLRRYNQVGNEGDANFRPARTVLQIEVELQGPNALQPVVGDEWIVFSELSNFGRPVAAKDTDTGEPIRLVAGAKRLEMLAQLKLITRNPNAPKKDDKKK